MARAGYIVASEEWRGTSFSVPAALLLGADRTYGWTGPSVLSVTYRYDPEAAGEPVDVEVGDGVVAADRSTCGVISPHPRASRRSSGVSARVSSSRPGPKADRRGLRQTPG